MTDSVLDDRPSTEREQELLMPENTQKQVPEEGTMFSETDILESPDALAMRMSHLSVRRITLDAHIKDLSAMIPKHIDINEETAKVKDAEETLYNTEKGLIEKYGERAKTIIATAFDMSPVFSEKISDDIIKRLAEGITFSGNKTIDNLITDLNDCLKVNAQAQEKYVTASQELLDRMKEVIESQNLQPLKSLILPIQKQLALVDQQIREIQTKIKMQNL